MESAPPATFEEHVPDVVRRIRSTLAESLQHIGADATKPKSVSRSLGLDKNLSWKICRLVRDEDPVSAVPLIPGKAGLKILMKALIKAGAPAEMVSAVQSATDEFARMVDTHSGDRETLGMMLAQGGNQREMAEAHRKLSFRGNSATWGVQARLQLCTNFIAPGSDAQMIDLAWISGLVDFWRLRRDASWAMAAARKTDDDGAPLPVGEIHAIDPDFDSPDAVPLMADVCSSPIPEMRIERGRDGLTRYELAEGPVGSAETTTCVIGLFGRNFVVRYRSPHDTLGEHFVRLYTPVETLIHDIFVHKDLTNALAPQLLHYSQMPGGPIFPDANRDRGLLMVHEPIIKLGSGPPDVVTPELAQYPRMIRSVYERLGWNAADFHGFRFRMKYPPIPTVAVWRYELPEAP